MAPRRADPVEEIRKLEPFPDHVDQVPALLAIVPAECKTCGIAAAWAVLDGSIPALHASHDPTGIGDLIDEEKVIHGEEIADPRRRILLVLGLEGVVADLGPDLVKHVLWLAVRAEDIADLAEPCPPAKERERLPDFRDRRKTQVTERSLLDKVGGKIVLVEPLLDGDDARLALVVET